MQYVKRDLDSQDSYDQEFAQSQSWAAWAYQEPKKSVELLATAFRRAYEENPRDLMRLSTLTEMIHQPIPEFERLRIFARAMGHYRRKKFEEAKAEIAQLPEEIKAEISQLPTEGGVVSLGRNIVIPIPGELLPVIDQEVNLWEKVQREGALTEAISLRYIRQISEALSELHQKGLIHGHITPHNIIVRWPEDKAVLLDFRIAQKFISTLAPTDTAMVNQFSAIEEYNKQEYNLGKYTDVYGVAATLYYLLTQTPPPVSTDAKTGG